jgi:ubiquinone/menaquinone biosynthesis C-methylase UbiE
MPQAGFYSRLLKRVQYPFIGGWYNIMSRLDRDADMIFMNYGWASLDPAADRLALEVEDEPNRYCIQLYHRVASAVDLCGLDVLEIGCGRGGGASYCMRYLRPNSLTGLDLATKGIEFCKRHYAVPGLTFVQGNAQALEFGAGTFDVVINVESSHCYNSMARFLSEVRRVLKPGGYFLFADHRFKETAGKMRQRLKDSGLVVCEEENISANVVKALGVDNARKQALIQRKIPRVLRHFFNEFAGMEGTRSSYATLRSGDKVYLRFVCQKVDQTPSSN